MQGLDRLVGIGWDFRNGIIGFMEWDLRMGFRILGLGVGFRILGWDLGF